MTCVIQTYGVLDADNAVEFRRALVRAVRRQRPPRLVVDLRDLQDLDAINLGTLVAACQLGDDHHVAVFLDHSSPAVAALLTAAGIPGHLLRHVTADASAGPATTRSDASDR